MLTRGLRDGVEADVDAVSDGGEDEGEGVILELPIHPHDDGENNEYRYEYDVLGLKKDDLGGLEFAIGVGDDDDDNVDNRDGAEREEERDVSDD